MIKGKMSTFGGPDDTGVSPSEGLALYEPKQIDLPEARGLFLRQPPGTTGLARRLNPDALYCAMRWNYKETPREVLRRSHVKVTNPQNGKVALLRPVDWGPHEDTGRVIDMSRGGAHALGAETDDVVECELLTGNPPEAAPEPPPVSSGLMVGKWAVGDDGFLVGVKRQLLPADREMTVRRCVVEHFTGGATAASSVEAMRERGVSAHLVVDRDGSVIQCVPFNRVASHAGRSRWLDPKTGVRYEFCNGFSIGIEIANAGDDEGVIGWAQKHHPDCRVVTARHRNGGREVKWEGYYPPQIQAVMEITKLLVQRYHLDDVTGHDCVAPERKNDPGPAFPMQEVREFCGFAGLPVVHPA